MTSRSRRLGQAVVAVTLGGARLGAEIVAALGPEAELHVTARWLPEAPSSVSTWTCPRTMFP